MKKVFRRKKGMRGRPVHWGFCLLLLLGFTAGLAVNAGAQEEYIPQHPNVADLTFGEGRTKTVVIRLLNMTPYNISADPLTQLAGYTDTNRKAHKSFMFAPLGIPTVMPGLKGTWTFDNVTDLHVFTPSTENVGLHPYNFVVSWDDQGGYVTDSALTWTVHDVYSSAHGITKDVPLRFWITREKSGNALLGDVFAIITQTIKAAVSLIADPANPLVWVETFTAAKEIAEMGEEAFEAANESADGDKMYFSAYPLPEDCTGGCYPQTITPSDSGETTDAVDAQWASTTGSVSSELVVTTQVLRGKLDASPNKTHGWFDMKVPIVSVTVFTPEQYVIAKTSAAVASGKHVLAQQLKPLVGTRDLSRYTQFAFIYKSLNPSQHRTLREAVEAFRLGEPLRMQQVVLIQKLIAALEKGQTKLSPSNR